MSRKLGAVAIVVAVGLFAGLLFLWPFRPSPTENVVRRILQDPTSRLRPREAGRLYLYLHERSIPLSRQAELIKAAFVRVSSSRCVPPGLEMLGLIRIRWKRDHTFAMLPMLVNEAIVEETIARSQRAEDRQPIRVDEVVGVVGGGGGHGLDAYLDIEYIMLSVANDKIIESAILVCHVDTLFARRDACLDMLRRRDIGNLPKRLLLGTIANMRNGGKWFRGREPLLEWLRSQGDEGMQEHLVDIHKQLKAETTSQPSPAGRGLQQRAGE